MDLELRTMFTFMGNVMIVKDPWPHIIEDNFLEPEMYKFLVSLIKYDKKRYKTIWCAEKHKKDYYEKLASKQRYDGYNHFDGEIYSVYAKYRIPYSKEIMDILCYAQDKLVERMMMLMPERLDNVKTIALHIQTLQSTKLKGTTNDFHTDPPTRLISSVVYTDKNNHGTFLGYPKQEIKPEENRALTFCSVKDKTWHAYVSNSDKPRTTFNFILKGKPDGD